jgi:hypothetical protein
MPVTPPASSASCKRQRRDNDAKDSRVLLTPRSPDNRPAETASLPRYLGSTQSTTRRQRALIRALSRQHWTLEQLAVEFDRSTTSMTRVLNNSHKVPDKLDEGGSPSYVCFRSSDMWATQMNCISLRTIEWSMNFHFALKMSDPHPRHIL